MLKNRNISGFTLVEMAMVLMIVGLLLGGLIPTISAQMDSQRISKTQKQLNEIRDALTGFAIINGRLPMPACGTIATGQANAGIELTPASAVAFTCTSDHAVVPWATLGVDETDAWGRRFTYRVTSNFADDIGSATYGCTPSAAPTQSSFALCSNGDHDVKTTVGGSNVATNVPAVIVSHGVNGLGAYKPGGGAKIGTAVGDELENSNNDITFVSKDQVQDGFDDIVIWLSPNTLANRMVTAGKLP